MTLELDGTEIRSIAEFHSKFQECAAVPEFYGHNLDALWDTLTGLLNSPLKIVWKNSSISKEHFETGFLKIVEILSEAAEHNMINKVHPSFEYNLVG